MNYTWTERNICTDHIPELTDELKLRIEQNTERLIEMTAKDWMRNRRKKANMTKAEQKEVVKKLEEQILEHSDGTRT